MSIKCKYCNEFNKITSTEDEYMNEELIEGTIRLGEKGLIEIYCGIREYGNHELRVFSQIEENELFNKRIKINYCPMCGRKIPIKEVNK